MQAVCVQSIHGQSVQDVYPGSTRLVSSKMASYPAGKAASSFSAATARSSSVPTVVVPGPGWGLSVVVARCTAGATRGWLGGFLDMHRVLACSGLSVLLALAGAMNYLVGLTHQRCDDNEDTYCAGSATFRCSCSETNVCTATR